MDRPRGSPKADGSPSTRPARSTPAGPQSFLLPLGEAFFAADPPALAALGLAVALAGAASAFALVLAPAAFSADLETFVSGLVAAALVFVAEAFAAGRAVFAAGLRAFALVAFFGVEVGIMSPTDWMALEPASTTASAPDDTASPIVSRTPFDFFLAMAGCLDKGVGKLLCPTACASILSNVTPRRGARPRRFQFLATDLRRRNALRCRWPQLAARDLSGCN